jgi:hypothetical protein
MEQVVQQSATLNKYLTPQLIYANVLHRHIGMDLHVFLVQQEEFGTPVRVNVSV